MSRCTERRLVGVGGKIERGSGTSCIVCDGWWSEVVVVGNVSSCLLV